MSTPPVHPQEPALHPIVARQNLAPNQLAAVVRTGAKTLVVAGAGTGKTRTLTARILHLLAQPETWSAQDPAQGADSTPLRRIAAITFTRKAAREMRTRLRAQITSWLRSGEGEAADRSRWERVLFDLEAAPIGTIHGLCTDLLRAHPAEARLDPEFGVLEEGDTTALVESSLDVALAWAVTDPAAEPLVRELRVEALRTLGRTLIARRLEAERALSAHAEAQLRAAVEATRLRLRAFVENAEVASAMRVLEAAAERAAGDLTLANDSLASHLPRAVAAWRAALDAEAEGGWGEVWRALDRLRANLPARKGVAKVWLPLAPKSAVDTLRLLFDAHLPEMSACDHALDETLLALLPALREFHTHALAAYTAAKDELRVLDFDDLEERAVRLLQNNEAVRRRWQSHLVAILVDEFQDTNERQRQLIDLLAREPAALTFVGDPKQSIYRFRGANVAIMQRELESTPDGGVLLSTSYRTHGALVDLLNSLLEPVLSPNPDVPAAEQPPFAPLEVSGTVPPRFDGPFVELLLAAGTKEAGALHSAADLLASRLRELNASGLHWSEMAILCRTARSFEAYEDALERAGVPYVTVAGRGFFERPEVRDVVNALRALEDPTDNLALLGLLRSPAVGLDDPLIFALGAAALDATPKGESLAGGSTMAPGRLWSVLRNAAEPRVQAAVALIAELSELAGRSTVATLIKEFYDRTGYAAALELAGHARSARNLAKLHEDALVSGQTSVGAFLAGIELLQRTGAREGEARADAEGVVQILTVHSAKGLEWPVVVIGDASASGGSSVGRVLVEPEGITLNLSSNGADAKKRIGLQARLARDRTAAAEKAESDRLLYVAATRAQQLLIVSGNFRGRGQDGWLGRFAGSLNLESHLGPLLGAVPPESERLLLETWVAPGAPHTPPEQLAAALTLQTAVRLVVCATGPVSVQQAEAQAESQAPGAPAAVKAPLAAPLPVHTHLHRDDGEPAAPRDDQNYAPGWVVSRIVHEALAVWRFPDADSDADFATWVESRARSLTLTNPTQIQDAVTRANRQLLALYRDPLREEIDGALDRFHDLPYHGPADFHAANHHAGHLHHERGRADLLYRSGDGRWIVVDFKTDSIRSRQGRIDILQRNGFLDEIRRHARVLPRLLGAPVEARLVLLDDQGGLSQETIVRAYPHLSR